MRKLAVILAALALSPAVATANDLSANLTGAGQGFASLQASGTTISYGIVTNGIGTPTRAVILQGAAEFIDLQATFSAGSAFGTVATSAANIAALNADTSSYTLRVEGSGNVQGDLVNNGATSGGTPGTIEFGAATFSALENAGTATITVNRAGGTNGAVTIDYATADGTAVAGTDYQAASGTLNWADGDAAAKTFTVTLLDNAATDGDLTVNLTLSNPTGGAELGLSAATLTIIDEESLVCIPDATTLCLNKDDRFKAQIEWRDFQGNTGDGQAYALPLRDSGLFYFFAEDNIEMLLKVLDACDLQGFNSFWVFYAATTNVEFTLTVTDTQTGQMKQYSNALGTSAPPVLDTAAFLTCP